MGNWLPRPVPRYSRPWPLSSGRVPEFVVEAVGYGAGKHDYGFPNTLRVMVGESQNTVSPPAERMIVLETNLDDLNPQLYESVMDSLFAAGAHDVFLAPIQMKKNRPATLLSVLCDPDKQSAVMSIVFAETSTLGVRLQEVRRACLERTWETVQTAYGPIRMKIGQSDRQDRERFPGVRGLPRRRRPAQCAVKASTRRCGGVRVVGVGTRLPTL